MSAGRKLRRRLALVAGATALIVAGLAVSATASAKPAQQGLPYVKLGKVGSVKLPSGNGTPMCGPYVCYPPQYLRQAYNFPAGTNMDGTGQTIIIVDAYGSPTIQSDLLSFDRTFGVKSPFSLTVIQAAGTGAVGSGDTADWGFETSLDVEYAHAMAPGAKIVLVEAASDNNDDINAAEAQVFPHYPGAVISQSFGDPETDPTAGSSFSDQHQIFWNATQLNDTILASAGDDGAGNPDYTGQNTVGVASYPSSDPLVTGVGGTQGNPYPDGLWVAPGGYGGEQVWNEYEEGFIPAATGGAPSILFSVPTWQQGVNGSSARTVADVSYNAAVSGGVLVFYGGDEYLVGGTSAGSPQWAAIFAIVNQVRRSHGQGPIGFANPALYRIGTNPSQYMSDFHDITLGDNALYGGIGFSAATGYDLPTGWGTPNVTWLVHDLANSTATRGPTIPNTPPAQVTDHTSVVLPHIMKLG